MSERKIRKVKEKGHDRKFLAIIDDSQECESAVYFAAARARNLGAKVLLLYVVEPEEFQHWLAVEDIHREEGEQRAHAVFRLYRRKLAGWGFDDIVTEEITRHGEASETIVQIIEDDEDVAFLVLGASTSKEGPGRLVTWFTGKQAGSFPIPIVIVPGGLKFEEIDALS